MKYKLILLSAPAGYGKTTSVIEALRDFKYPVGWISLDAGDNIPGTFWRYFIVALQSVIPGVSQQVLNALQSPQPPPVEWVSTSIINSISDNDSDFVMVLDDYHIIESPEIHRALTFFIEHMPARIHLVISSRIDPPLPVARWRVKGEMVEIRASDLSFTIEEAAALIKQTAGISLAEPDLTLLENRTEGWVAGLKMAALSLQGKQNIPEFVQVFSGSNRYIMDYLAEEVLNQQPASLKKFLLETSILERLCGPLCDAVTEGSDSQSLLTHLETANLFISPLDDERNWYRYHQLFASILHNQLVKDQPQRVNLLHQRASIWYEKAGLVEESIKHSLQSGDHERAALLLENAAPRMLGQNQAVKLLEYMSLIPEPVVLAKPWLCVYFAWAALTANRPDILSKMLSRSIRVISEAPEKVSLRRPTDFQRLKGHVLSLQSIIAQSQDDITRAIQLSEEANRTLPSVSTEDLLARAVNSLNLGGYYQKTGDITRSVPLLKDLISVGRQIDYHYAVLAGLGSLAEIELHLARLSRAAGICQEAIELSSRWGGTYHLPVTSFSYVTLGKIHYEQNNLDAALDNLKKGVELGESSYCWDSVIKGCLSIAKLAQTQGNFKLADEYLRHAERSGPWVVVPPEVHQIPAVKAWLSLQQRDLAAASEWARQQEISLPLSQLPGYQQEFAYLMLVRVKLAQGSCQGIPSYLDQFIGNARRQERSAVIIEALILKALVLDCLGDSHTAVDILDGALTLAEPSGYIRIFIDEGEKAAALLHRMIQAGKHVAYASKLLGFIDSQSSITSFKRKNVPELLETLSQREFEILKLIASGKSNQEIGSELFLAIGTVKKHTNNIFGKLGVVSRTQAVARAREMGLI